MTNLEIQSDRLLLLFRNNTREWFISIVSQEQNIEPEICSLIYETLKQTNYLKRDGSKTYD